jgi:hypothetical protein
MTRNFLTLWQSKAIIEGKAKSDSKKVFDLLGWNMAKTVQKRKEFLTTRKQLTKQENKLTLQRKNTET